MKVLCFILYNKFSAGDVLTFTKDVNDDDLVEKVISLCVKLL